MLIIKIILIRNLCDVFRFVINMSTYLLCNLANKQKNKQKRKEKKWGKKGFCSASKTNGLCKSFHFDRISSGLLVVWTLKVQVYGNPLASMRFLYKPSPGCFSTTTSPNALFSVHFYYHWWWRKVLAEHFIELINQLLKFRLLIVLSYVSSKRSGVYRLW